MNQFEQNDNGEVARVLEELKGAKKIIGAKQVIRGLSEREVRCVYIATDADMFVTRPVFDACREKNVRIVETPSMKALGEACGVRVKAAAVALLKD